MSPETKVYDAKMQKTIEVVKANFASVRAGRANAGVLDRITVEYYGTPTPLNQVAAISSPDPRTLMIQPWDASILHDVEKAILASDLGLTPNNDGKAIRLNFPAPTEERRKELVKVCRKYGLILTGPLLPVLVGQWGLDRIQFVSFQDRCVIEALLAEMRRMTTDSATSERFSAAIFELLLLLARQRKPEPFPETIRDVCDCMERRLAEKIRIAELAALCRMSLPTFNRLFREAMGWTPYQWLIRRRMETAFQMLTTGKYRIKEVASSVGYTDPLHFSREFNRVYHMSPREAEKQAARTVPHL